VAIFNVLALRSAWNRSAYQRSAADWKRRALYDGLTGCLTREAFISRLEAECVRSERTGAPFSLLLVDVDHFKDVNDRHGHEIGDRVLAHLAATFRAEARSADSVGRLGGDEFAILLPDTDVRGAVQLAERLGDIPPAADRLVIMPTVSTGLTGWAGATDDAAAMLRRADLALYDAKRRGRHRFACAG